MPRRRKKRRDPQDVTQAIAEVRSSLSRLERVVANHQPSNLEQQQAYEAGLRERELEIQIHRQALRGARHDLAMQAQQIRQLQARQESDGGYRRGYNDGLAAGRSQAPSRGGVDRAAVRDEMRREMLEQCRVIAESNPNMAPGVNAVRHRIKKL